MKQNFENLNERGSRYEPGTKNNGIHAAYARIA